MIEFWGVVYIMGVVWRCGILKWAWFPLVPKMLFGSWLLCLNDLLRRSLWLVFPLFLWKKSHKLLKNCAECAIMLSSLNGIIDTLNSMAMIIQIQKMAKNTVPCTENYNVSLEAMPWHHLRRRGLPIKVSLTSLTACYSLEKHAQKQLPSPSHTPSN